MCINIIMAIFLQNFPLTRFYEYQSNTRLAVSPHHLRVEIDVNACKCI